MSRARRKKSISTLLIKGSLGENVGLLWKEAGDLVTQNIEKAEELNDIFVFFGKCYSHTIAVWQRPYWENACCKKRSVPGLLREPEGVPSVCEI